MMELVLKQWVDISIRGVLFSLALVGFLGWMLSPWIELVFSKPGICAETGGRMEDAAFIKAAVEEWAVGPKTYFSARFDGPRVAPLWPSAQAYLAEFPQCCEIYEGPAADWFDPPDKIPALWGQQGRVVRLSAPMVDFADGEPNITFAQRFTVLDDCALVVDLD